jgi:hypothetical protein
VVKSEQFLVARIRFFPPIKYHLAKFRPGSVARPLVLGCLTDPPPISEEQTADKRERPLARNLYVRKAYPPLV